LIISLVDHGVRKGQQLPWIVSDELWARIQPLLPVVPHDPRHPGRPRLDDRKALCGILFVLYTAIPWEFLPQELGFGSGMTCWRRLRDWNQWLDACPQLVGHDPWRLLTLPHAVINSRDDLAIPRSGFVRSS
jgi:transposase